MVGAFARQPTFTIVRRHRGDGATPSSLPFLWRTVRDQRGSAAVITVVLTLLVLVASRSADPSPYILVGLLAPGAIIALDLLSRVPEDRVTGFLRIWASLPIRRASFVTIPVLVMLVEATLLGMLFVLAVAVTSSTSPWSLSTSLAVQIGLTLWNIAVALPIASSAQKPAGAVAFMSALIAGHALCAWTVLAQFDIPVSIQRVIDLSPGGLSIRVIMEGSLRPLVLLLVQGGTVLAVGLGYLTRGWSPSDGLGPRFWGAASLMVILSAIVTLSTQAWIG